MAIQSSNSRWLRDLIRRMSFTDKNITVRHCAQSFFELLQLVLAVEYPVALQCTIGEFRFRLKDSGPS